MKKLGLFTICLLLGSSLVLAQTKSGGTAQSKSGVNAQSKPGASGQARAGRRSRPQRKSYSGCDFTTPVANPDGWTFQDFIDVFADNFVNVNLKAGHSYSAEAWDPSSQNVIGNSDLFLFLDLGDCSGDFYTDVTAYDPDLSFGFANRISWIQGSDANQFIDISSFDNVNSHFYYMRIVDTTLYNSRWSTVLGFSTHYGFLNTTNGDVQSTLTLTEANGTQHAVSFTVPAFGEVFEVISAGGDASPGLQLPPNLAGSAALTFIGPPGAIKADGYFQAVQSGVFVIVPTEWAPRNSQH